jgi:uncharacterized membrane protein
VIPHASGSGWLWFVLVVKGALLVLAGIFAVIAAARRPRQTSGPSSDEQSELWKEASLNQQFSMGEITLEEYERRMREIRRASR